MGGWEGREEAKALQVNTQGPELPTDDPDRTTRLKGHHSGQGLNSRPITIGVLHRCQCVGNGFTRL